MGDMDYTKVEDVTADQVAACARHIRTALSEIQRIGNDWNAGIAAGLENDLGNALIALGLSPTTLGGRTDDVPGNFDAGWLYVHASNLNTAVKDLENWYLNSGEDDEQLKSMLVGLRQQSETVAFASATWAEEEAGDYD